MYRLSVEASDRGTATVTWQIDTHRKECRRYVLRELSHQFRVGTSEDALEVLMSWEQGSVAPAPRHVHEGAIATSVDAALKVPG